MENTKKISFNKNSLKFKELKKIKDELENKNLKEDNRTKELLLKLLNFEDLTSKEINVI